MSITNEVVDDAPSAPSAILDRLSLILDAFEGRDRLGLAEIVMRTGLPRSSAHRMLERLVALRWLSREGRSYSLGIRLVELGSLAVHQDRVHAASMEHLHHLYRTTGMVVHLAVLDGEDVVYLEKIGGRLAPLVPTRIGGRRPAHTAALGRALLAYNGHEVAGAEAIRERGVAFERNESVMGFGCIASPIGPIGEARTAVSVCGPLRDMSFDSKMITPLRLTSTAIWRSMCDGTRVAPTLQRRNMLRSLPTASRVLADG
ncbi:UNVERIFIED_ORG: IclR family transcriptional regulator [Gordonia westfalica J30]